MVTEGQTKLKKKSKLRTELMVRAVCEPEKVTSLRAFFNTFMDKSINSSDNLELYN